MPPEVRTHDFDGDGFTEEKGDCDDNDAEIYPDQIEICDEIDNNCNNLIDDGVTTTFYIDIDGDGYGQDSYEACEIREGLSLFGKDCDETVADSRHYNNVDDLTGSSAQHNSYLDFDCDGDVASQDCDDSDPETVRDRDCDGIPNEENGGDDCNDDYSVGLDYGSQSLDNDCDTVLTVNDCDDNDASSTTIDNDNDCDGLISINDCDDSDASQPLNDADCDGILTSEDCDDSIDSLYSISEDTDCDGFSIVDDCDDSNPDAGDTTNDADCDGYYYFGPNSGSCLQIDMTGSSTNWNLHSIELTVDGTHLHSFSNKNNAYTDTYCFEGKDWELYWKKGEEEASFSFTVSLDSVSHGSGSVETNNLGIAELTFEPLSLIDGSIIGEYNYSSSTIFHYGESEYSQDCDDSNPSSTTVLNDYDCDGVVTSGDCDDTDSELGGVFIDADCDGITTGSDCDDNDANLGETSEDTDCDGILNDDDCDADDPNSTSILLDADCDGFEVDVDCNDEDSAINTDAIEICDQQDNDCDGYTDEGVTTTYYRDLDGDGFGNSVESTQACSLPEGYSTINTDCNDGEITIFPNAPELCDGLINTCGGSLPSNEIDDDGDGFVECTFLENTWRGSDFVDSRMGGDCDDSDPLLIPEDSDGDGFSTCTNDCDDNDAYLNPADVDADGFSTCDLDCDDDDPYLTLHDFDQDGYTTCDGDCDDLDDILKPEDNDLDGATSCEGDCDDDDPTLNINDDDEDGFSTCDLDCDDENSDISPGVNEVCADLIDNDCDGGIDNADLDNDSFISVECNGTDCDDNSDTTYPGAAQIEDPLGDFCMQDADGDGYGSREPEVENVDAGTDCDDDNPDLFTYDETTDGCIP